MASDGRVRYSPLAVSEKKGELEPVGMVLPALTADTNTVPEDRLSRLIALLSLRKINNWRRRSVIAALVLTIIIVLIGTIASAIALTKERERTDEFKVIQPVKGSERQTKPKFNFESDLRRVYEKLMDDKRPEDLKNDFDYYKTEVSDVRNASDLRDFLAVLELRKFDYDLNEEDVRIAVKITEELYDWYTYLEELRRNLTRYETQKTTGSLKISPRFVMSLRQKRELEDLVAEWTEPISVDVEGTRTIFKKKVIIISEVMKHLRSLSKIQNKDVYVFASAVVYLDEDISLPGVNLAVIAPEWSFVKGVHIFLNGLHGLKHENDTAAPGVDGLPGRRGGNGGCFLGIGNVRLDDLRVQTDGGDGGDGQHGSNGRDGTMEKPEGFISFKNIKCKKLVNEVVNIDGEVIRYYEVYHDYGCGGDGTDGGAAGPGGDGGRVMVVNLADGVTKIGTGRVGQSGKGGRGGAPGSGANWGCRFYAEEIKPGNLERVTKEVCGFYMPSGVPGRDGWNGKRMGEPPRDDESIFVDALRKFRAYAREEFTKGRMDVWRTQEKLDELDIFDNRTIVRDFMEEINEIETSGKIEFYDSLNRRIERGMKRSRKAEVLAYLRTLSYGKALTLRYGIGNYVIIDLDTYLEKISDDMESIDKSKLSYVDHTTPIFLQLLRGKVNHLTDALDQWLLKTSKLIAHYDLELTLKSVDPPRMIDGRNMAYLTSITVQAVKTLSSAVLIHSGEEIKNITTNGIATNDLMIHNKSKSSTERFSRHCAQLVDNLKSLSTANWKSKLRNVKHLLQVVNSVIDPQSEVSDFPYVLDYLESTAKLLEIVREREKFGELIAEVNAFGSVSNEAKPIRDYLFDSLIIARYRNALSIFRQWVFPHMHAYSPLLPQGKNLTVDDAKQGIQVLRKSLKEYKSTITCYDRFIREAVFTWNNSVGEYYKWYNDDIRSDLIDLFNGREISLTADLENFHILRKNAIKFRTVHLEFLSGGGKLYSLLKNVQIEMRHSGYSYYYYNGRSYLQVSDILDLRYSYETTPTGLPVNFNMVYKKLMDGPPIFSPYTTWNIRLHPVPEGLIEFAGEVDLALVGLGSYIEI